MLSGARESAGENRRGQAPLAPSTARVPSAHRARRVVTAGRHKTARLPALPPSQRVHPKGFSRLLRLPHRLLRHVPREERGLVGESRRHHPRHLPLRSADGTGPGAPGADSGSGRRPSPISGRYTRMDALLGLMRRWGAVPSAVVISSSRGAEGSTERFSYGVKCLQSACQCAHFFGLLLRSGEFDVCGLAFKGRLAQRLSATRRVSGPRQTSNLRLHPAQEMGA